MRTIRHIDRVLASSIETVKSPIETFDELCNSFSPDIQPITTDEALKQTFIVNLYTCLNSCTDSNMISLINKIVNKDIYLIDLYTEFGTTQFTYKDVEQFVQTFYTNSVLSEILYSLYNTTSIQDIINNTTFSYHKAYKRMVLSPIINYTYTPDDSGQPYFNSYISSLKYYKVQYPDIASSTSITNTDFKNINDSITNHTSMDFLNGYPRSNYYSSLYTIYNMSLQSSDNEFDFDTFLKSNITNDDIGTIIKSIAKHIYASIMENDTTASYNIKAINMSDKIGELAIADTITLDNYKYNIFLIKLQQSVSENIDKIETFNNELYEIQQNIQTILSSLYNTKKFTYAEV